MSVRFKLVLGFAVIIVLGVLLALAGLRSVETLTGRALRVYETQKATGEVSRILNAHFIWRQELTEAVLNGTEFMGSLDPNQCALGKWLRSERAWKIRDPELKLMRQRVLAPHVYIHNAARNILLLTRDGKTEEARRKLTEDILPKTQEVITLLTKMEDRLHELTEGDDGEIAKSGEHYQARIRSYGLAALVLSVIFVAFFCRMISRLVFLREHLKSPPIS